ncbi:MAG: TetR/AcrR family transcriptional regulator [Chromatiales bacterium]|jgi:AcrR family transcriptional regulator
MEKPVNGANGKNKHQQGLEEILSKSSRLMAEVGFHGTTMRELSRVTSRSLSGLYHYFGSKEDLLYLINFHGFTTLNEAWKRMSELLGGPREHLYGFIYLHTHYYVANIDEMRVMNWGTQELEYERAMTIRKLKDHYTAVARDIVAAVNEEATGEALDSRRLARQTFLLFGMMNWIFGWYSARAHGAVEDLVRDIYGTFLHGITGAVATDDMTAIETRVRDAFAQSGTNSMWETLNQAG